MNKIIKKSLKTMGEPLHLTAEAVHGLALEVHQVQQLVHLRSQYLWEKYMIKKAIFGHRFGSTFEIESKMFHMKM